MGAETWKGGQRHTEQEDKRPKVGVCGPARVSGMTLVKNVIEGD